MISRRMLRIGISAALLLTTFPAGTSIADNSHNRLAAKPADRPFRILVLGDSVTWGQGLATEHKFSFLTANWVCEQRNGGTCPAPEDVVMHVEAHSGAVLAEATKRREKREDEACGQEIPPPRCQGEIPNGFPTIW